MKKLFTILLLLLYSISSFGFTIKNHYCGKYLTKTSISGLDNSKPCSCSTGSMKKGCCRDDYSYQKGDTHKILDSVTTAQQDPVMEILHHYNHMWFVWESTAEPLIYSTFLVPPSVKDRVILYRVFRI